MDRYGEWGWARGPCQGLEWVMMLLRGEAEGGMDGWMDQREFQVRVCLRLGLDPTTYIHTYTRITAKLRENRTNEQRLVHV